MRAKKNIPYCTMTEYVGITELFALKLFPLGKLI
jgi:hypothetical protein